MSVATIVLSKVCYSDLQFLKGDIIGVDYGAWFCYSQNIPMKYMIGDFDSIDCNQLDILKQHAPLIHLPKEKNENDFEAALIKWADQYDEIIVVGGLHGRVDQEQVNLRLLKKYPQCDLVDINHRICCLSQGIYPMSDYGNYYISLMAMPVCCVSTKGFKYEVSNYTFSFDDVIGLSNEIIGDDAQLWVHHGHCLVICSQDK